MMPKITIRPGYAILAGLLIYFVDINTFLLILLPVMIHELGHWFILCAFKCRITEVETGIGGLTIRYMGYLSKWQEMIAASAGPLSGVFYALLARCFGPAGQYSAGISLMLSAVNLIPCLPLDGGRIAAALINKKAAKILAILSACATVAFGIFLYVRGNGAALMLAGMILLPGLEHIYGSNSAISPD